MSLTGWAVQHFKGSTSLYDLSSQYDTDGWVSSQIEDYAMMAVAVWPVEVINDSAIISTMKKLKSPSAVKSGNSIEIYFKKPNPLVFTDIALLLGSPAITEFSVNTSKYTSMLVVPESEYGSYNIIKSSISPVAVIASVAVIGLGALLIFKSKKRG